MGASCWHNRLVAPFEGEPLSIIDEAIPTSVGAIKRLRPTMRQVRGGGMSRGLRSEVDVRTTSLPIDPRHPLQELRRLGGGRFVGVAVEHVIRLAHALDRDGANQRREGIVQHFVVAAFR
jgi:hypothetical protein